MPIPVSCPSCGTSLKAPDSAAGRKVKCPKCATPFAVPAAAAEPPMEVQAAPPRPMAAQPAPARRAAPPPPDDDGGYDEGPPARRPMRRPDGEGGPGTGLQLGLGVAGLAVGAVALPFAFIPCLGMFAWPLAAVGLILGAVGLVIGFSRQNTGLAFPIAGAAVSAVALGVSLYWWFAVNRAVSDLDQFAKNAQQQGFNNLKNMQNFADEQRRKMEEELKKKGINPGGGGPVQATPLQLKAGVATVEGQLTDADPKDKQRKNSPAKAYTINLAAGKQYQIDLMSDQFDAFLRLENAAGQTVAENDDIVFLKDLNSRIIYPCNQPGEYRITVTCVPGAPGRGVTGAFTLKVQEK
jgi:hypothetical protein